VLASSTPISLTHSHEGARGAGFTPRSQNSKLSSTRFRLACSKVPFANVGGPQPLLHCSAPASLISSTLKAATGNCPRNCVMARRPSAMPFALVLTVACSLSACGQTRAETVSVESLVRDAYPGWNIQHLDDEYCPRDASVSGDFNGDSVTDHAVRLTRGNQGLVVAFISNGSGFDRIVLDQDSRQQIMREFLVLLPRGSRHLIIQDDNDLPRRPMVLAHDAPGGGTCEASSYVYVIEGLRVTRAFTSD